MSESGEAVEDSMQMDVNPTTTESNTQSQNTTTTTKELVAVTQEQIDELLQEYAGGVSIEDFSLPKAVMTRLAKAFIPSQYHIQAEAKSAIGKAAVVFISYLTAVYAHSPSFTTYAYRLYIYL